jgi:probable HAF family extracellular repeat protein
MNMRSVFIAAMLTMAPSVWAEDAPTYSLTDLGTLGGLTSYGTATNSHEEVTGYADTTGNTAQHAFVYRHGLMEDLGTLGGTNSTGNGINAAGHITGYADTADNVAVHAFLFSHGRMRDLGTLGGTNSRGYGINSAGEITGASGTPGNTGIHAFLYRHGVMHDLGTLAGPNASGIENQSGGQAINSRGQITGSAWPPNGDGFHVILYSHGTMYDIGAPDGVTSFGNAINAHGEITGVSQHGITHPTLLAFLYSNGVLQSLGALAGGPGSAYSEGLAINDAGQVTGSTTVLTAPGLVLHAFIYSEGVMTDLNTLIDSSSPLAPYVTLAEATGINDCGLIVANGVDSRTGHTHAYLLVPRHREHQHRCEHEDD